MECSVWPGDVGGDLASGDASDPPKLKIGALRAGDFGGAWPVIYGHVMGSCMLVCTQCIST